MNILPLAAAPSLGAGSHCAGRFGIRPEHLLLCEPGQGLLTAKVEIAEYTGASSLLHVVLDGGEGCPAICEGDAPVNGAQVGLAADPANLHFFAAEGQALRPA